MTKETYIRMTKPFRDNPKLAKCLHILNRLCTGGMYLAYPLLLAYLFWKKDAMLQKAILIPAISFVSLSFVRKWINRKRPYEAFEMPPVIPKKTKGNSFPSRHVFSSAMIAMTFLLLSPWNWLGMLFLGLSVILAAVRVLSGVHYISDVLAGLLTAIVCAIVGY
uniref:phosphatase PAP2 family protein n=1 Tax=Agathobacter sp. TaxID=2021311 RepID=UPI004055B7CC